MLLHGGRGVLYREGSRVFVSEESPIITIRAVEPIKDGRSVKTRTSFLKSKGLIVKNTKKFPKIVAYEFLHLDDNTNQPSHQSQSESERVETPTVADNNEQPAQTKPEDNQEQIIEQEINKVFKFNTQPSESN